MRVNGFKLLQEDTLYFYFFCCVVHLACPLFNVNSSYQTVVYTLAAVLLYLMSILKTFIIINAYEFYF